MATKVIGGCVSYQKIEIVIPNPLAEEGNKKTVSIN